MTLLKNIFCKKMGLFRFYGGKKFFCGGARGRAALDCADCCEAFQTASGSVWMDARRSWARVDGRSWAREDGCDGGCACLI